MTTTHDTAIASARAAEEEDFFRDLLPRAARLAVEAGYTSRRMVHRKMRVDWGLAGDLLVELADAGVVGDDEGDDAGTRQVLVEPGGLADTLAKLATLAGDDPPDVLGEVAGAVVAEPVGLAKTCQSPDNQPGDTLAIEVGEVDDVLVGEELAIRQDNAPAPPPATSRRHLVAWWLRWHYLELTAVVAPAAAAVAVSPWWVLPGGLAAAWWAREEIRHTPRQESP